MAMTASLAGCGSRTQSLKIPDHQLTKEEMEADMADRLKLRDVKLTDQGGGRFTGTGSDSQGKLNELEVSQDGRRLSWKTKWKGLNEGGEGSGSVAP
jgi:hypothetical protein